MSKAKDLPCKNRDWLYQKYVIEKLSTLRIAKEYKCGSLSTVRRWLIRHGIPRRKGGGNYRRLPPGEANFNALYSQYKYGAKNRGLEFNVTREYFRYLTKQDCFYCGTKPSQIMRTHLNCNGGYIYNGIDRIDNSRGYVFDNMISCCRVCNYMKGRLIIESFGKWVVAVYNHLNKESR